MKSEYDFSKAKKNPYIEKITKIINTDKTLTAKNKKSDTNTANTDTRHITDIPFQYTPLNFVQQGIWLKDNITNMNCFKIAITYIEKYGVNAFTDKDHAEEYLRELTRNNHIINTAEAQSIINNSVMQIFPKITSPDDVTVFYEDNSAVPLYYATESTDMVYNWNGIFDESVYKVWAASTDRESQSIMQALYGSPYVMKECVAVVDSNMNQVGTFKSMNEARNQLKGKIPASNNNNSSNHASNNPSTDTSKTNENSKNTQPITNPSYEMYYDKNYNFQCCYPTHFTVYNDSSTFTCYAVQSNDGRVKERICAKQQNGSSVESELNNFISQHSGEITYKTSGNDYYAASVYDGTTEYYRFCKFKNGNMYWFDFDHPYNERDIYSKYIDKIYATFHIAE